MPASAPRGVITAMATPFEPDGKVDVGGARMLAGHLVEHGSHGVVVAGTTGESPTLDDAEKLALLEAVIAEVGDRAQVICGTGSNDTRHSAELTRAACEAGTDAVLVVTPYYNKPNEAGIRAHFEAVAAAAGETPVVIYNIPSRCVVNIAPPLLSELARIPNVVAVKQANNDEVGPIEGLELLAGNDDAFLRCLEVGGAGGILVASHVVGDRMREIYEAMLSGDRERARAIDSELRGAYSAMAVTTNPIPVKAALAMLGLASERMRLPMVPAAAEERAAIRRALQELGLLDAGGAA